MPALKYLQLAISEIKQDHIRDFNLTRLGNNIALLGSDVDIITLQLLFETDSRTVFPYAITHVPIPQTLPCTSLIKNVNLLDVYKSCNVQESQELSLDPVYISECSGDTPKIHLAQALWAPTATQECLIAVLNAYGGLQLYTKKRGSRKWKQCPLDINGMFKQNIFPVNENSSGAISMFQELKTFTDLFLITSFAWMQKNDFSELSQILYTANAAGYIVAFIILPTCGKELIVEYCRVKTSMGRINYLKEFENFLLVGNVNGVIRLFKVVHRESNTNDIAPLTIIEIDCLWSRADRMACHQAEVTYVSEWNSYLVVFTKAAHVLAYRISKESGTILSRSTLYIAGVKITGIETLSPNEFIITTTTGIVRHIQISCPNEHQLSLDEEIILTAFDTANMQIVGVATSKNHNIWSFMLYHNKEYTHQSKYNHRSAFISIGTLNTHDALTTLMNLNNGALDNHLDYAIAIRMDILNNFNFKKYTDYCDVLKMEVPQEFNDAYLQKLQLKLLILESIKKYQKFRYQNIKNKIKCDIEFVLATIQITHILLRLQYMIKVKQPWSEFQNLAINCMRNKFYLLIQQLLSLNSENNDDDMSSATIELKQDNDTIAACVETSSSAGTSDIIRMGHNQFEYYCSLMGLNLLKVNEKCINCDEPIDNATMLCPSKHNVHRCCFSFVQVPFFNKRGCDICQSHALEDDTLLQQLLSPEEKPVKCIFCRFTFNMNDFVI